MARRLIGLHVDLAGIFHHMGIGEDPSAVDDHAGAFHLLRTIFSPWPEQVRSMLDRMNLDDQIAYLVLRRGLARRQGEKHDDE